MDCAVATVQRLVRSERDSFPARFRTTIPAAAASDSPEAHLWPFRFVLQIAFESEPVFESPG